MIVYAVTDPRKVTLPIFYVGATKQQPPTRRLRRHLRAAKNGGDTYKYRKIRAILASGARPGFVVIGVYLDVESMMAGEIGWISRLKVMGHKLTNHTAGGDGCQSPDDVTRAKRAKASRGRKHSEAARKMISDAKKGIKRSPETRRKISEALKGIRLSAETKAKMSAAHKGKTFSPETRRKLSVASKGNQHCLGKKHSPETRRKLAEASRGHKHSEETRRKMSAAHKGIRLSDERRAKMSEAQKRRWAREREPL